MADTLPDSLGLDVHTDGTTVALIHAAVNGQIWVEGSLGEETRSGGISYDNGDRLEIELVWHDLLRDRVWRSVVALQASRLPTFADRGVYTALDITLGPGADVTVTSLSAETMYSTRNRDAGGLAIAPDGTITFIEACAAPASKEEPVVQAYLNHDVGGPEYDTQLQRRNTALAQGAPETGRCEAGGGEAPDEAE